MSTASYIDIAPGTGQIIGQDIWATINQVMHQNTPEVAQMEQASVQQRTPVRTGALQSDVVGIEQTDPDDDELALINSAQQNELDQYGRVYNVYVEGVPLGHTSPTILNPAQMYNDILTSDIPQITNWAQTYAQEALDLCAKGKGVPSTP